MHSLVTSTRTRWLAGIQLFFFYFFFTASTFAGFRRVSYPYECVNACRVENLPVFFSFLVNEETLELLSPLHLSKQTLGTVITVRTRRQQQQLQQLQQQHHQEQENLQEEKQEEEEQEQEQQLLQQEPALEQLESPLSKCIARPTVENGSRDNPKMNASGGPHERAGIRDEVEVRQGDGATDGGERRPPQDVSAAKAVRSLFVC